MEECTEQIRKDCCSCPEENLLQESKSGSRATSGELKATIQVRAGSALGQGYSAQGGKKRKTWYVS